MPRPRKGETRQQFVDRCSATLMNRGEAETWPQARALSFSIWFDHRAGASTHERSKVQSLDTEPATAPKIISLSQPQALSAGDLVVDAEKGVIKNASVLSVGPALGHGFRIGKPTLQSLLDAWDANPQNPKMRLSHPENNVFRTRDGAEVLVGRAKNPRLDGEQVRADLHIANYASLSPSGDLKAYLLSIAEEDPSVLGLSIVAAFAMQDGTDPATGEEQEPMGIVEFLKAVDFVDDPAANRNGLLSQPPEVKKAG